MIGEYRCGSRWGCPSRRYTYVNDHDIHIWYKLCIYYLWFFNWGQIIKNEPAKLGIMERTIVAKHVWCLPLGRRILIHFNEYDQPIRREGFVIVHFLSELSKDGTFSPLKAQNWKRIDDHYKKRIIKTIWVCIKHLLLLFDMNILTVYLFDKGDSHIYRINLCYLIRKRFVKWYCHI